MRPFNKARDAEILRRVALGESYTSIAKSLDISRNVIGPVCRRAGCRDPMRVLNGNRREGARRVMEKYGLFPEELDQFRDIKDARVPAAEAASIVIASRKNKAA